MALSSHVNWVKPELRFMTVLANMHMRRLVEIGLIKPETIASNTEDNRHVRFRYANAVSAFTCGSPNAWATPLCITWPQ
jgi:hypothetical protein